MGCCDQKPCETPADSDCQEPEKAFWCDPVCWRAAGRNTLTCLFGCSLGDFGMLAYLQVYHPGTSPMLMMALAMAAGLCTSILLETLILMARDRFGIPLALRTALAMSFLSMLAMEAAMNLVDYALTGFETELGTAWYWIALAISMLAGFLVPLPYNYWKLKKHGKACH